MFADSCWSVTKEDHAMTFWLNWTRSMRTLLTCIDNNGGSGRFSASGLVGGETPSWTLCVFCDVLVGLTPVSGLMGFSWPEDVLSITGLEPAG